MLRNMLEQATYVYERRNRMNRQALVDSAVSLGEWNVFSNRQIAAITGLTPRLVNDLVGKKDRTGGTLNVEDLRAICKMLHAHVKGRDVSTEVTRILGNGTSSTMLARLTGIPRTTLQRWARIE